MGFTKLDEGILQSSIMLEDDATFKVFMILLAACKEDGIARVSPVFLASITGKPIDLVMKCLEKLEAPDPYSRSLNDEGRRIHRIDGGYEIINYHKYRQEKYSDTPEAIRKRKYRQDIELSKSQKHEGFVYFLGYQDRIKIGFSVNPWARFTDLKTTIPELKLLGYYRANRSYKTDLHKHYQYCRIDKDWFRKNNELDTLIGTVATTVVGHSASASASASASELRGDARGGSKKKSVRAFVPPTLEALTEYCQQEGYGGIADRAYKYYVAMEWHDSQGKPIRSWKGKLQAVWFKPENRDPAAKKSVAQQLREEGLA